MSKKHQDPRWQRLVKQVRPALEAQLPRACARCGQPMMRGMKLDVGHITRDPMRHYDRSNVRLEHRRCNRQDGQRITSAIRTTKRRRTQPNPPRPRW